MKTFNSILSSLVFATVVAAQPQLPQIGFNTTMPTQTGIRTIVPSGANLQSAINSAQPGDTLVLSAGATYTGAFSLPVKANPNSKWIVITSSNEGQLPPAGKRISPANIANMPTIEGTGGNPIAVQTDPGAGFYRFVGIRFTTGNGVAPSQVYGLIRTGTGSEVAGNVTNNIIFDRILVQGHPTESIRAMFLNGKRIAVLDSYISDFKCNCHDGGTSIGSLGGGAEFIFQNNYFESAGIGVIFGGGNPHVGGLPTDIIVRGNYFFKQPGWETQWPSKTIFELKFAKRVLFEGNVMENVWASAQHGQLFNLKSDNGQEVGHVTIRNNFARGDSSGGFQIAAVIAKAGGGTGIPLNNTLIEHNIFTNLGSNSNGNRHAFQFSVCGAPSIAQNMTFTHNTFLGASLLNASISFGNPDCVNNFILRDNIFPDAQYGVKTSGSAPGTASFNTGAPGAIVEKNAFIGHPGASYPANNYYPADQYAAGLTAIGSGNFSVQSGALKNGATDGKDVGADIAQVMNAIRGAVSGDWGSGGIDTVPPNPPTGLGAG